MENCKWVNLLDTQTPRHQVNVTEANWSASRAVCQMEYLKYTLGKRITQRAIEALSGGQENVICAGMTVLPCRKKQVRGDLATTKWLEVKITECIISKVITLIIFVKTTLINYSMHLFCVLCPYVMCILFFEYS